MPQRPCRSCSPSQSLLSSMRSIAPRARRCAGSMLSLRDLAFETVIWTAAAVVVLLLVAPTLIVVAMSFTGDQLLHFPPRSWSLRWYAELIERSPEIAAAAWTSLQVATIATSISLGLGTLASLA